MSTVFNGGRQQQTQANQFDTDWTFDKVETLKRLWAANLTQSEIAAELGVSRNTIAGKISRLKLTRSPSKRQPRKPRVKSVGLSARPTQRTVTIKVLDDLPEPERDAQGVQLMQLTNTTCRWPFGSVGADDFHFCGVPTADFVSGRPYCREHTKLARRT